MRKSKIEAAREQEWRLLEHPAEEFDSKVWACPKWASGCDSRVIETPPYADRPPAEKCGAHELPMTEKVAERRTIRGRDAASARF